jgi:hypothetical protein
MNGHDARDRRPIGARHVLAALVSCLIPACFATATAAVWQDPDFDPRQRAVYYVRVLEIPTPRWSTYDAARFGNKLPPEAPRTTRERAYTSPIWYSPENDS